MTFYLLEYLLVDDYLQRREPLRAEHLALIERAHQRGELRMGGALAEPADRALLVWQTERTEPIEEFVRTDPYVREGVVTSWSIRPWTVVVTG